MLTGLVQFVSVFDLLIYNGYSRVVSFCLAIVLGYLPVCGTVAGFVGALHVWRFSVAKAFLVFCPAALLCCFVASVLLVGFLRGRRS